MSRGTTDQNRAERAFLGNGETQGTNAVLFDTCYSPEIIKYLLHSAPNTNHFLRYVFMDDVNSEDGFRVQLESLIFLSTLQDRPVLFICKEPGHPHHWVAGFLNKNDLLIWNPLGLTRHQTFYKTLAKLQEEVILKKIVLWSTKAQHDPDWIGDVSCGPLCVAWVTHMLNQVNSLSDLLMAFESNDKNEKHGLTYFLWDSSPRLLERLSTLAANPETDEYISNLLKLRGDHLQELQTRAEKNNRQSDQDKYWEECLEAPEQQLVMLLLDPKLRAYPAELVKKTVYKQLESRFKNSSSKKHSHKTEFSSSVEFNALRSTVAKNSFIDESFKKGVFNNYARPNANTAGFLTLEEVKLKDIKILIKIYGILSTTVSIKNSQKILLQIATLLGGSDGLSYNDTHDPTTYCLRNRYGYRQRNKGTVNQDLKSRIDFEAIFRTKALIENGKYLRKNLKREFFKLRKKIAYILKKEFEEAPEFVCKISEFNLNRDEIKTAKGSPFDLERITDFVKKQYPQLIFKTLQLEATILARIVPDSKENIYVIARKFVIIGELFHELSVIKPEEKSLKKRNVFSLFNRLNLFRNRFIHFSLHLKIIQIRQDGDIASLLERAISGFSEKFSELMKTVKSLTEVLDDEQQISLLRESRDNLIELADLLRSSKKGKVRSKLLMETYKAKQLLEIIRSSAYHEIKTFLLGGHIGTKLKKTSGIIKKGVEDDNPALLLMLEKHIPKLRSELDAVCLKRLVTLLDNLKTEILGRKIELLRSDFLESFEQPEIQQLLIETYGSTFIPGFDINSLNYNDEDSNRKIEKLRLDFYGMKDGTGKYKPLIDFFTTLKGKLKKPRLGTGSATIIKKSIEKIINSKDLSTLEKQELLDEFNFEVSQEYYEVIKELSESVELKKSKAYTIRKYTHMICKEVEFLHEVESQDLIYKNFVKEHIITIVGQYVRDIDDQAITRQVFLNQSSSLAGHIAKQKRSKGLAHEIFNFDPFHFESDLSKHILPAKKDFKALGIVAKFSGNTPIPESSQILLKLAGAYHRLSLFRDAIKFNIMALKCYFSELKNSDENGNSFQDREQLKAMGITETNTAVIDKCREVFGISLFEIVCRNNLMTLYFEIGNLDGFFDISKKLFGKLNKNLLLQYKEEVILNHGINKEREISNKFDEIVSRIDNKKRAVILEIDHKKLYTSVSYSFSIYYRGLIKVNQFEEAKKSIGFSFKLLITSLNKIGNKEFVESFDMRKLLEIQLLKADCEGHLGNHKSALRIAKQVLGTAKAQDDIENQLVALRTIFQSKMMCNLKIHVDKMSLEEEVKQYEILLFDNMNRIKSIYGDTGLKLVFDYYAMLMNVYIYERPIDTLEELFEETFEKIKESYQISRENLISILTSMCIAFSNTLLMKKPQKEAEKYLNYAKKYFSCMENMCEKSNETLKNLARTVSVAIANYADYYTGKGPCAWEPHRICLNECLVLQIKYNLDTSRTRFSISIISQNEAEYYRYNREPRIALERYQQCVNSLKALHPSQADAELSNLINERLDCCFKSIRELREQGCQPRICNRDGLFFPLSRFSTRAQPYGPYSDYLCTEDDYLHPCKLE